MLPSKIKERSPPGDACNLFYDHFLCGCIVTNQQRKIVFSNNYFETELGWERGQLEEQNISILLSRASQIFCDSYIVPILAVEHRCDETQVTLIKGNKETIPAVIYAKIMPNEPEYIYWTIVASPNRNRLYNELISTREKLETKAEALQQLATIDELTGVKNRRELMRQSEILINQTHRGTRELALLFIDIDLFKDINDKHGHQAGDSILTQLGEKLNEYGRNSDIIGRYGGEEFVILIADADRNAAEQYAQRLHSLVKTIQIDQQAITVSIGISLLHRNVETSLKALLSQADEALYHAKDTGRDRTVFADELLPAL